MRPRRTPRTVRRRDNGILRIRSNEPQTYPGVDLPPDVIEEPVAEDADRRLFPARDTGLEVQTRLDRRSATSARRQRAALILVVMGILMLITGAIGWRYVSDRMAAATPLVGESASKTPAKGGSAKGDATGDTSAASIASATPVFAYHKKLELHLPVPMRSLTEIGFHQAAYAWALHMRTPLKDARLSEVARTRSTGRKRSLQPSGPGAVMTGQVLRMWRSNRSGRPDTAADVGALAGSQVLSPVTGTVVRIRPYKLYGRYPDYELHIIPEGQSSLDVVLIHLTDVTAVVGEHVVGGVTPIARVRKLSDRIHDQLAEYTKSPGDHVHMQVNDANYKGYKGLDGAVDPGEYDDSSIID